jgi:glycogen debranching enzyme
MAAGEGSYNPIGYHVGTVWPHDTGLVALGLQRSGYRTEATNLPSACWRRRSTSMGDCPRPLQAIRATR